MCGISGFLLRDPSFRVDRDALLTTLLDEIETRGTHATGYVAIGGDGTLEWHKAACKASVFNVHRRRVPDDAGAVLGHTRWATQGLPSFMENNHPIRRGPFYIIHNGHVSNDTELFVNATRARFGDVDSEAIAARLSSLGDLKFLGDVIAEIEGDAAVAAVDDRDPTRLVLARGHSSPLWIYNGRRIVLFASTEKAVKVAYEKHIGRIGKERLICAEEGTMFAWKGESEFWTQPIELPQRWSMTRWTDQWDDGWSSGRRYRGYTSYSPGKVWDTTQKKYVWESELTKTGEDKLEGAAAELAKQAVRQEKERDAQESLHSYDFLNCDGCDKTVAYLDIEYIYDDKSQVTLHFCDDCYCALFDEVDGDVVDDEDEDAEKTIEELLDEYRGEKIGENEYDFTSTEYDDYAGANSSILRHEQKSLIDRIASGLFFRGF